LSTPNVGAARRGFAEAFQIAKKRGFEGLVAKRLESVYVGGRSRDWSKVKVNQEDELASGHLKALDLLAKMMISFPETVKPRDVEDKVCSAKAKLLKLLEARYGSFAEGAAEPDQPSGQ
jgi:hypothetical protein